MQPNSIKKSEVSVKDIFEKTRNIWRFILTKKRSIITFGLIGALLGLLVAFITKPTYKAELTFVLEGSGKTKLGGYSSIAAQFGLNLGDAGGMFQDDDNIIALIQSRIIISRTLLSSSGIGDEILAERYMDFTGLKDKWKNKGALGMLDIRQDSTILRDSVLGLFYKEILKSNLVVGKPDKKLDIISISTSAPDEVFAKTFTEKLLENVTDFYTETQTKKSQENVSILTHQVDSVRGLLNDALTGVALSSERNPNLNPAFQTLKVPSQKKMIDVEMNKAILVELVKNLELAEVTLRKETPLFQIIDKPVLPLERSKVGKIKGTLVGLTLGIILSTIFFLVVKYFKNITS